MWRWKSLVFLVLIYKHSTSQPITEDGTNDRPTRQVDFEECCPCSDKSDVHHGTGSEELLAAGSESAFSRMRHVDDCPCRPRLADSEGASSVFFPTAMRAAGSFVRAGEKKDDLKPLFNPEVDLASSVLQTLREATDEEYQDALARDATKGAKAAENFVFGDATPQESANIVTIVVNPSSSLTDNDDIIPQASNIKQARCIHPLQSSRSSLGKMRVVSKPSLFLQKPRLGKLKSGLLHRNFYDMDSGMGASNIHEHIVPTDEGRPELSTDTSPLRVIDNTNDPMASNTDVDNCSLGKLPNLRSTLVQNKLKDLDSGASSFLQNIRDKTVNSLSRMPKLSLGSLLADKTSNNNNNNDDLGSAPSTIHEQRAKKVSYFRNNSPLQSITSKRPLSIANLLNLRDVELIPVKDLINKRNKPNIGLPSNLNHDNTFEDLTNKNTQLISNNNADEINVDDPEGSPSLLNIHVSSNDEQFDINNCDSRSSEGLPDASVAEKVASTEILDPIPDIKDKLPQTAPIEKLNIIENETDNKDTILDASNNVNNIIQQHDIVEEDDLNLLQDQKEASENSCNQDEQTKDSRKLLDIKPKLKVLDTSALSNIKDNIVKKLEDFKNIKTNLKSMTMLHPGTVNNDKDVLEVSNENQDEDCQNEASIQITTFTPEASNNLEDIITTSNPDIVETSEDNINSYSADELSDNSVEATQGSNKAVSLQDLQKLSDSMLRQEEEERDVDTVQTSKFSKETEEPSENENSVADWLDSNKSADSSIKDEVDPGDLDNLQKNYNEEDACKSNLVSPKTSFPLQPDSNAAASDFITNVIPKADFVLDSQPISQPRLTFLNKPLPLVSNGLKLPRLDSLPTFDDIKEKLTDLFDNGDKVREELSLLEPKNEPVKQIKSNLVMATDASTSSFQSKVPPSRYLEDVNFDILELKSQSNKLPNMPKIGLHSYKTKLPLPKDISLKPIKLQSALENKRGLLGPSLSIGETNSNLRSNNKASNIFNDPLGVRPRLNEVRDQVDLPIEATNNIHSALKNTHKTLEYKLRKATNKNLKMLKRPFKSASVLKTLSRNHEDINDKLRGLHMDLNDRLETMRNEIIDRSKLLTSSSHIIQPMFRSSSNFNKAKSRKPVQHKPAKISASSKTLGKNKFRMPAAASVPVPKTVQVPELKETSEKWPSSILQRGKNIVPIRNVDAPSTKLLLGQPDRFQSSNPLLGKQVNLKKDSKIKVTFSTTPRPVMMTGKLRSSLPHVQTSKIGKTRDNVGSKLIHQDHYGLPSEVIKSKIAAPVSDHVNKQKYSKLEIDSPSRRLSSSEKNKLKSSEIAMNNGKSVLQSWPKANESSFLTKVKDAVQTRLSKMNSVNTLKQGSVPANKGKDENLVTEAQLDMARSASENRQITNVPQPLKENVSYKCKMVCTKD